MTRPRTDARGLLLSTYPRRNSEPCVHAPAFLAPGTGSRADERSAPPGRWIENERGWSPGPPTPCPSGPPPDWCEAHNPLTVLIITLSQLNAVSTPRPPVTLVSGSFRSREPWLRGRYRSAYSSVSSGRPAPRSVGNRRRSGECPGAARRSRAWGDEAQVESRPMLRFSVCAPCFPACPCGSSRNARPVPR